MTYRPVQVYTGSEWVNLAVGIADPNQRIVSSISGTTKTLALSDAGKMLLFTSSSSITLTIPTNASVGFVIGQTFSVVQDGTGVVTVAGDTGVTLTSRGSRTKTNGQYAEALLTKVGTDEWLLSGDITS